MGFPPLSHREEQFIPFLIIICLVVGFIPLLAVFRFLWRLIFVKGVRISIIDDCKYMFSRIFGDM